MNSKIPQVNSCCFIEPLQKAIKYTGVIELILFAAWLGQALVEIEGFAALKDINTNEDINYIIDLYYPSYIIIAVLTSIQIVCSLLLMIAGYKEKSILLLPWLIFTPLNIVLSIVVLVLQIMAYTAMPLGPGVTAIIIVVINLVSRVYFFLAVNSYRLRLNDSNASAPPSFARNA